MENRLSEVAKDVQKMMKCMYLKIQFLTLAYATTNLLDTTARHNLLRIIEGQYG